MTKPSLDMLARQTRVLTVALDARDRPTCLHSERVRSLAVELGKACGLNGNELKLLDIAACFHDIGKLGIPDRILLKPASLDETEREYIRQHCLIGEAIMLATDADESEEAASAIRHHHEYFSGRGYPDRLAGEDIPVYSRIIGISDSYDAMAETRAYHRARSHEEVIAVMQKETGDKHDPYLMKLFCRMVGKSDSRIA